MALSLSLPKSFNLDSTARSHGWFQCSPFHYELGTKKLWRTHFIPGSGPVSVGVTQKGEKLILHSPKGLNQSQQKWLKNRWVHMLSLAWDLSGFFALCRKTPNLKGVLKIGGGRLLRCGDPWEESVKGICGTNVAWPQAVNMINRLGQLGPRGEDNRPAWPGPELVIQAGESWLREVVRLGYRAPYVINLAKVFVEKKAVIPKPDVGTAQQAFAAYKALPGIGPATAHYLMILNGHFGTMSVDSAVHAFVKKYYSSGKKLTEKQVRALFAPYGEWVGLAYWWEFMVRSGWLTNAQ